MTDGEQLVEEWDDESLGTLITSIDALVAQRVAEEREAHPVDGCPCLYTTPCHPRCTCVTPSSSVGCSYCCRYGSIQQQRTHAKHLAAAIRRRGEER